METSDEPGKVEACPEENSAIYRHQVTVDVAKAEGDLETARNEWQKVENNIPGLLSKARTTVNYEDLLQYLETQDMTQYLKQIKPTIKRRGLTALLHCLIGPPALKKPLVSDRNFIFSIAQYPCDLSQSLHSQVLHTIYKELTGTHSNYDTGSHWEDIGFQGNNPTTDLRGAGFLGLLHLLYFVTSPKTSALAQEVYKLSTHSVQHFPFCVMSINMTRITLETLREEILNRECNKRRTVFPVANEFYVGTFLHLYSVWRQQKKTIMDSGYVIRDVSKHVKANSKAILEELGTQSTKPLPGKAAETDLVHFTDIGNITHPV